MNHRPDPSRRRPLAMRLAGLAALAGAVAALGCTKSPMAWTLDFAAPAATAGKPVAPNSASFAPSKAPGTALPTLGASQAPASPAATAGTPSPTAIPTAAAIDPADPLPSPSTDSDLAPAEQAAVEQALASEDLLAYLPSELIHDGGVVLYRTMALDNENKPSAAPAAGKKPLGPPPAWARKGDGARSGPQLVLRRDCADPAACAEGDRPVRATVRYQEKGVFTFRDEAGVLQTKRYGALSSRVLLLRPTGGTYALAAASPISVTTSGGRAKLEIAQVSFFGKGSAPIAVLRDEGAPAPVASQPRVVGTDLSRVEVDLVDREAGEAFVFLTLPGQDPKKRLMLLDDGLGVDQVAGDGRFSGQFVVPNRPGVQHAVIDVVDPKSFLPAGAYRSNSLGFSFRVDVREGG